MGKRFIRSDWNIVVIGVYSRLVYVAVLPRKEYIYSIRESVVTYEIVILPRPSYGDRWIGAA